MADDSVSLLIQERYDLPGCLRRRFQEELRVPLGADGDLSATLYAENPEPGISNSGQPVLRLTSWHSVEPAWLETLSGIERGEWPKGFTRQPNQFLFDYYPPGLQDFCLQVEERLNREALRIFGLVRWRLNDLDWQGRHLPPGRGLLWSADGEAWHRLRMRLDIRIGPTRSGLLLTPDAATAVAQLEPSGGEEPLGREMWHSAVAARDERTGVILAVSAVEVEVKRLLAELVPKSEWLLTTGPSPPLDSLIFKYLRTLLADESKLVPPRQLRSPLRKAVECRNEFLHAGDKSGERWVSAKLTAEEFDAIMSVTSDLLWLFDAIRGHEWALERLDPGTRVDIGLAR